MFFDDKLGHNQRSFQRYHHHLTFEPVFRVFFRRYTPKGRVATPFVGTTFADTRSVTLPVNYLLSFTSSNSASTTPSSF